MPIGDRVIVTHNDNRWGHFCEVNGREYVVEHYDVGTSDAGVVDYLRGDMIGGGYGTDNSNSVPRSWYKVVSNKPFEHKPVDEMAFFTKRELPNRNYKEI